MMLKCYIRYFYSLLKNIIIWYQLNSQLVWEWGKGYKSMWIMSLLRYSN